MKDRNDQDLSETLHLAIVAMIWLIAHPKILGGLVIGILIGWGLNYRKQAVFRHRADEWIAHIVPSDSERN